MSQHGNDSGNNAPPPPPGQGEGEIRVVQAEDVEREVQEEGAGGSSSHRLELWIFGNSRPSRLIADSSFTLLRSSLDPLERSLNRR